MLTTFAVIIIFWVVYGVIYIDIGSDDLSDYFVHAIITILSGVVIFMAGMFTAGIIIDPLIPTYFEKSPTDTTELASIRSSDGVFGKFYLGWGTIGSTQYFFFNEKVAGDSCVYKPGKIAVSDNVIIKEGSYKCATLKSWSSKYRWNKWMVMAFGIGGERHYKYEFLVPFGTIERGYKM